MRTINFYTFRGTKLCGEIFEERRTRFGRISFVRMLGRFYAVMNGTSINETDDSCPIDSWASETSRLVEEKQL